VAATGGANDPRQRAVVAAAADLAAVMERAAADLGLAEEPAGFTVALETAASGDASTASGDASAASGDAAATR
jgi:hypothetical protein